MARDLTPSAVMAVVDDIMSARLDWITSDCCRSACDVFHALHGIDPMAALRDRYCDAMGAARIIKSFGGFVAMAEALAAGSSLIVSDGRPGDIGVSARGAAEWFERRALLICIESGAWAGKTDRGYAIIGNAERCWRA